MSSSAVEFKKTITGEDGNEVSELEYLTEIRRIRDEEPDLFERIKRLPKRRGQLVKGKPYRRG